MMRRWIHTPLHTEIFKSSCGMNFVGTLIYHNTKEPSINCITQVIWDTFLQLEYCQFVLKFGT